METSEGLSSSYRQASVGVKLGCIFQVNPKEDCVFRWNGRALPSAQFSRRMTVRACLKECHGSRLHLAARDGDIEGVKSALKE